MSKQRTFSGTRFRNEILKQFIRHDPDEVKKYICSHASRDSYHIGQNAQTKSFKIPAFSNGPVFFKGPTTGHRKSAEEVHREGEEDAMY